MYIKPHVFPKTIPFLSFLSASATSYKQFTRGRNRTTHLCIFTLRLVVVVVFRKVQLLIQTYQKSILHLESNLERFTLTKRNKDSIKQEGICKNTYSNTLHASHTCRVQAGMVSPHTRPCSVAVSSSGSSSHNTRSVYPHRVFFPKL